MANADRQSLDGFLARVESRALVMSELVTRDRDEALDVVQEAMLAFARRYAHKSEKEWAPLFYRVLQNKQRDWQRRGAVRRRWRVWLRAGEAAEDDGNPIEQFADPAATLPEDLLGNEVMMTTLVDALGELPDRQRQAVVLRIWEQLDVASTADAMGCSAGSVKTHLSRGLSKLRACLESQR